MNIDLLKQKVEMLEEYFCIHIDAHGKLCRLPVILDQYTPDMDRVPEFVLCLGNDVRFISIVFGYLLFYFLYNNANVFAYYPMDGYDE